MDSSTTGSIVNNNTPSPYSDLEAAYQNDLVNQGNSPQPTEPGYLGIAKAFFDHAANAATLGGASLLSSLESKFPSIASVVHNAAYDAANELLPGSADIASAVGKILPNNDLTNTLAVTSGAKTLSDIASPNFGQTLASDKEQHPIASIAGQVAGSVAPFALTAGGFGAAESLAGAAKQGAMLAGITSANQNIANLNNTDWNADTIGHAITNIALQSILGEAGGAAGYGVGKLLTNAGSLLFQRTFGTSLGDLADAAGELPATTEGIAAVQHAKEVELPRMAEEQQALQDAVAELRETGITPENADEYHTDPETGLRFKFKDLSNMFAQVGNLQQRANNISSVYNDLGDNINTFTNALTPAIARALTGGVIGGVGSGITGHGYLNPTAILAGGLGAEFLPNIANRLGASDLTPFLEKFLVEKLSQPDILNSAANLTIGAANIADALKGPLASSLATSTGASLPNATYDTIMNNVNTLNPDQVVSALAPLASPDEHQSAVQSITNAITRIKNTYNGDTPPQDPLSPIQQDVPNDALLNMNRLIQAYNDPMSTLQDGLESGVLHPEALAAIKEAYPDLYSKIQANLVNAYGSMTQDQKLNIPASRLDTLRQILGTPDPNLNVQPIQEPQKPQSNRPLNMPDISSATQAVSQRLSHTK